MSDYPQPPIQPDPRSDAEVLGLTRRGQTILGRRIVSFSRTTEGRWRVVLKTGYVWRGQTEFLLPLDKTLSQIKATIVTNDEPY